MKKKVIIVSVVLVLIISTFIIYKAFTDDKNKDVVVEKKFDLVSKNEIILDNALLYVDDYIVGTKKDKVGIIKDDGTVVIDFSYDDYISKNSQGLVLKKDSDYIYFRNDGTELFRSLEYISAVDDMLSNKSYLLVGEGDIGDLYDSEGNILKSDISSHSEVVDNYIVWDNEFYDYVNQKVLFEFDYYQPISDKYLIFYIGNVYKLYDGVNKQVSDFDSLVINDAGYHFSSASKEIMIDNSGEVVDDIYHEKISDEYLVDYSVCDEGGVLKNKDGEIIIDECYSEYNISLADQGIYLAWNFEQFNSVLFFNDGTRKEFDDLVWIDGNYIFTNVEDNGQLIYNFKGEQISNDLCYSSFYFYKDGIYVCDDGLDSYFVDVDYNKVSEKYDSILCYENDLCVIEKDSKYGIYYNQEVIIEPSYYNIDVSDNKMLANKMFEYDILTFGYTDKQDLNLRKVNYNFKIDLDVEEIIKEYQLENISDLINSNKVFFEKYAYVVLNNEGLGEYKKEVFDVFKIVALNKKYLEENYFLEKLMKLSMNLVDEIENSYAVGTYNDTKQLIEIEKESNIKSVIYHELTHFIDYSINKANYRGIYLCDQKYYIYDEFYNMELDKRKQCEEINNTRSYNKLVIEAGAEVNSAKYMNDGIIITYHVPTLVYETFSYLYGEDTMREVFFDKDGVDLLFKLLRDSGLTFEEYKEFIGLINLTETAEFSASKRYEVVEYLLRIYKNKKNTEWYNDKYMVYIVSSFYVDYYDTSLINQEYVKYLGEKIKIDYYEKIAKGIDEDFEWVLPINGFVYQDGKGYMIIQLYKNEKYGQLKIDYDFEKEEVISYLFKEYH